MNRSTLPPRLCSIQGCDKPFRSSGMCKSHYCKWFYAQPVEYLRRKFHLLYFYRMPGQREKHLAMAKLRVNHKQHLDTQKRHRSTPRGAIAYKANHVVRVAIRNGSLERRPCEKCGSTDRIHAHHCNYFPSEWLNVMWLCTMHHGEWHRLNKPIYPSDEECLMFVMSYRRQRNAPTCSYQGCEGKHKSKGLCHMHYQRKWKAECRLISQ